MGQSPACRVNCQLCCQPPWDHQRGCQPGHNLETRLSPEGKGVWEFRAEGGKFWHRVC